jgi:hypothetical protein
MRNEINVPKFEKYHKINLEKEKYNEKAQSGQPVP